MRKLFLIALLGLFSAIQGMAVPVDISVNQTQEFAPDLISEILKEAAHCAGISETEVFSGYDEGNVHIEKIPGAYEVRIEQADGGILDIIIDIEA